MFGLNKNLKAYYKLYFIQDNRQVMIDLLNQISYTSMMGYYIRNLKNERGRGRSVAWREGWGEEEE